MRRSLPGGFPAVVLACGLVLTGCTGEPAPAPLSPTAVATPPVTERPTAVPPTTHTPPAVRTPPSLASPSATVTTTAAFRELQASLELFSREMIQQGAPSVLIEARAGQQVWTHAAGVRSLEGRVRVQADDPVRMGALTRTMVAVSILKLVEEGRVGLDEPIATYVPEAGLLPAPGPLSVRQLLGRPPVTRADGLSEDDVLGLLLERLRGSSVEAVLRTDIVEPLNLRSMVMVPGDPVPGNLVHGYVVVDGATVDITNPPRHGAGMIANTADINAFYAALLEGKLLPLASLVELKGSIFAEYGLGLDHWDDRCTNGSYYGHASDMPGAGVITMSSADGNRQLTISVAYPPAPVSTQPSAIALEITGLAQVALNSSCRFQFR